MASYSVTVLEYAYSENMPEEFYLGEFAEPGKTYERHPMTITLVQGEGRNILIDTGMDPENPEKLEIFKNLGFVKYHSPKEVLATVGLTPDDIDTVIISHAHFDHVGALDLFKNATFYMQKREFLGWSEFLAEPKYGCIGTFSVMPSDIRYLAQLKEEGRLVLLDGDAPNIFPGISLAAGAFSHSFGLQMTLIESDGMLFIHCSDAANIRANLTGTDKYPFYIPNTKFAVGSPFYAIADYDRLYRWTAGNLDKLIMTHDAERRDRFPGSEGPLGLGIYRIC